MASPLVQSVLRKHIPTVLGLVILAAGLIGGIFLVNSSNTNSFLPRASPQTTPKSPKITNITDTSFTVSWLTDSSTPGYVRSGTSPSTLTITTTDDRDQATGSIGKFTTHHITVRSLTPQTKYYFKIGTGTQELYDNNGSPYAVTTATPISTQARTLYGEVVLPPSTPASGALVYVSSDAMSPMSTLVQPSGSWVISLSQARTTDLSSPATLDPTTVLHFLVVSASDSSTSLIDVPLSQSQPVPQIVLGQNFDYTQSATPTPIASSSANQNPSTATASAQQQSKFSAVELAAPTQSAITTLTINYPATNNEIVTTLQPQFMGTAPPSTHITLQLSGASRQSTIVIADKNGQFTWTPTTNLAQGTYTLAASALIQQKTTTVTRQFVIDTTQAGAIPSITASESGTIASPSPTPMATLLPVGTSSASAAPIAFPSTASGTPVTGTVENTIILLSLGAALFFFGAAGFMILM